MASSLSSSSSVVSQPRTPINFPSSFKFLTGSTAVISLGGMLVALLAVCVVWIIHNYDATFNALGVAALLVSAFTIVAMVALPADFSMSLLKYALVIAAVFLGFIYDSENIELFGVSLGLWIVRSISVGLIAVVCFMQIPWLINAIKLAAYTFVPILILGILAHYEFIPNWVFMILTVLILLIVGVIALFRYGGE